MRFPPAPPVARAVAATPADRDRVLDLMRAAALAVVVLGHATMGLVGWRPDGPVVNNTLSVYPWAPWATWALQIMPLFFVAGGAVNARSWRTGRDTYAPWLWRRVARLLRPVWVYLLIMAPASALISAVAPANWSAPLLGLATQLLWFIGVYVVVCALTPLAVRAHRANPLLGPVALLAGVLAVDIARLGLGLPPALGLLNFVLVWAFAAQLGQVLDDGLLRGVRGLLAATGAVAANLALTGAGPYPTSMVGLPGETFSNMAPPSLVLALHALALAGAVGAIAPALARLADRPRAWTATTAVNLTAMTLYLWHLPVLISMVAIAHLLGLDRPVTWVAADQAVPGPGFWLWTIPYFVVFLAGVAGVVRLLWPVEQGRLPGWDRPARTRADPGTERRASVAAACGSAAI
ncbi:MAG: acyltransferase, partial [Candidatus Nanopelagicales bacterium]